jgi:O-antigen ligase
MAKKSRPSAAAATIEDPWSRWSWFIVAGGAVVLPLVVGYGTREGFRFPKDLLLVAIAIAVVTILAAGSELQKTGILGRLMQERAALELTAAAAVWVSLTAALSSNRILSLFAVARFAAAAAIFLAALSLIRTRSFRVLGLLLVPGVVNAVVVLLQITHVWNPFRFPAGYEGRLMYTGLLGNANDLGVYLVVPLLLAMVLAIADRPWRPLWIALAAVTAVAMAAALTITAIAAAAAATIVLFFCVSRRLGIVVAVIIPLVVAVAAASYAPLRERASALAHAAKTRDIEALTSSRFVAFTTTWEMFREHPVAGVGPGCFPFQYMPYRLLVDQRYPLAGGSLLRVQPNFGEAHNDHLQLLAETGVPGYAIFLGAIALLASVSLRRRRPEGPAARTARLLALPLATAIFVSALTQFPLHLAAPLYEYLFTAAACLAWSRPDVA